jgi:hypothetical protein
MGFLNGAIALNITTLSIAKGRRITLFVTIINMTLRINDIQHNGNQHSNTQFWVLLYLKSFC